MVTKLGTIEVKESGYTEEGYPGYFVSLVRDDRVLAEVLFEVDETDEYPEVKIHVWDTTQEDPICDYRGCDHDGLKLENYS